MCSEAVDIQAIQEWLEETLGESVDWEINPQTLQYLRNLRLKNLNQEKHTQIILEDVERRRNEYIGETRRLERLLRELGVEDRSITGPSSAYLQVLTESCSVLREEQQGSGLEAAATKLLLEQADIGPKLAEAKAQIESVKADTLKLYGPLERLGEAVKSAEKEGKSDQALAVNQSKKLDFMHEKEKQYKTSLDKEEILLHKTTGGDQGLRHENIETLAAQLHDLEARVDEANRQISGYLNLPPSLDLARVEVAKAGNELRALTMQVDRNIQSINL